MTVVKLHQDPEFIGPEISGNSVIIEGRRIPRMRCHDHGEEIEFILDDRFSYIFPRAVALDAASFAAQALAVGSGFPWLGAPDKNAPFAPKMFEVKIDD